VTKQSKRELDSNGLSKHTGPPGMCPDEAEEKSAAENKRISLPPEDESTMDYAGSLMDKGESQ